jgi:hypothetical protein
LAPFQRLDLARNTPPRDVGDREHPTQDIGQMSTDTLELIPLEEPGLLIGVEY